MRFRMAAFGIMTSSASTRPGPPARGKRFCVRTPSSTNESWARTCGCWWGGKTSPVAVVGWWPRLGWEDVQDAVDRLDAAVGVERAEGEVAGLGDDERRLDGLEVAHLADEHD